MAVNCCFSPAGIEGIAGVTAIETKDGAVTVSLVEPLTVPTDAEIVLFPAPRLAATPPFAIVATFPALELQAAEPVRSCVLPSV